MCLVSSPKVPNPAQPARPTDLGARMARDEEIGRRRRASGRSSTLLTGPQGVLQPAQTTTNTLLGGNG